MPSSNPLEVHVKVFLDAGGGFHFESTDLPMGPNNFLYFHNCCHDGLYVHYDLQGTNNFVFPDKNMTSKYLDEALYSQSQPGCPTSKGQWGQFTAYDVQSSGKTLIVWNKNQTKQDFGYTLRITDDGGQNYRPLDPGGGNQNGPISKSSPTMLTAVAIVAAIAGAVATVGVQSLLVR